MKRLLAFALVLALVASAVKVTGSQKQATDPTTAGVVKGTGTVIPAEVVDIGAQVAGRISKFGPDPNNPRRTVDHGTVVKKGTLLAQIDPRRYEAELVRARAKLQRAEATLLLSRAQVNLAERELQRTRNRHAAKIASEADVEVDRAKLDTAKAAVAVSQAAVAEEKAAVTVAEMNRQSCDITAPCDGVIIDRRVNLGQTVVANLSAPSLFLIARDLKKMQVWVSIKEADVGRVAKGQQARFTVPAYPKATFKGKVAQVRLNASMDRGEVTYTVVIDVDDHGGKLLPYLTARVSIDAGGKKDGPR
jgi:HlyD family secretion protein